MAFEEKMEDYPDDEKGIRDNVWGIIGHLCFPGVQEVHELDKTPNLSNVFNVLNGKSVSSITNYVFYRGHNFRKDGSRKLTRKEKIIAEMTIERGDFQNDIFGAYCTPYRKTKLICPNGLELETEDDPTGWGIKDIPAFGVRILEKGEYNSRQIRRKNYFLGLFPSKMILTPRFIEKLIPTTDILLVRHQANPLIS